MTSTDKLMNIDSMINGDGGVNFIKIRLMLDDIDSLASEGNAIYQRTWSCSRLYSCCN